MKEPSHPVQGSLHGTSAHTPQPRPNSASKAATIPTTAQQPGPSAPLKRRETLAVPGATNNNTLSNSGKSLSGHMDSIKRKETVGAAIISQKERDLVRDIKLALRADQWNKLPDLLADWEVLSTRDVLVECGIQFLHKERGMCEKILDHVLKRGPLKSNEYSYASAMIHLAHCQYFLSKQDECTDNLRKGIKFIETYLRKRAEPSSSQNTTNSKESPPPPPGPEWADLKDWASVYLSVICLRRRNYEECLRLLDTLTNYQLVLNPKRFAFLTLVKSIALYKLGFIDDAIKTLNRRQSQEEALSQLGVVEGGSTDRKASVAVGDGRKMSHAPRASMADTSQISSGETTESIHACHDLHLALLIHQEKEAEARDLFQEFKKDGSNRPQVLKEFVKKIKIDDIGKHVIDSWAPNPNDLIKKM